MVSEKKPIDIFRAKLKGADLGPTMTISGIIKIFLKNLKWSLSSTHKYMSSVTISGKSKGQI